MNAAQVASVLDRLAGEFEFELDETERRVWTEALSEFPLDAAQAALDRLMDVEIDRPTVADFRRVLRPAQAAAPRVRQACHCMNGWEIPDESNFVVACHSCEEGRVRGEATEAYRAERAQMRRRIHGPALLTEKPAADAGAWIGHARATVAGEAEPAPDAGPVDAMADLDF